MTPRNDKRQPGSFSEELRPYVDRGEAEGIDRAAERLLDAKPQPSAAFRVELYSRLSSGTHEAPRWRPRNLGRLAFAYAGSGLVLLAIAALGVAGTGPLGY